MYFNRFYFHEVNDLEFQVTVPLTITLPAKHFITNNLEQSLCIWTETANNE